MTYPEDAAQLARALADLLTADQTALEPLPAEQVRVALVCRDTVVGAVRDLTGALLSQTSPPVRAAPDLLVRSPAHALHAALQDLRPVSRPVPSPTGNPGLTGGPDLPGDLGLTGDLSLTEALAADGPVPVAGWQRAARAAVVLERHHEAAAVAPGPAAWSLARDLAALSAVLTVLDADLAAVVVPPASNTPAGDITVGDITVGEALGDPAAGAGPSAVVAALVDEPGHALLQLAAAELTAHTADVPFAAATLSGRPPRPAPPRSVRQLADLPGAGRHLAELLRSRGSHLTVPDARAALRAVAEGVDLTARAFAGNPTDPAGRDGAVEHLQQALPDLQYLVHSPLATLTPSSPGVLSLSQQMRTRLAAAGRLHDELQARPAPAGAHAALAQALARWAVTAAPIVEAVHDGLRAAADTRALLAPRQDPAPARYKDVLWLPLTHRNTVGQQGLEAAGRAAAALHGAAEQLTPLLGPAGGPPPQAVASDGTRRAAADASAAFSELAAALQSRPAPCHLNPARTAHPAVPGDGSRRHPPRR